MDHGSCMQLEKKGLMVSTTLRDPLRTETGDHGLLQNDIGLLKPPSIRFLEHYGYDMSWQLAEGPTLDAALESPCVRRIVGTKLRIRRADEATK